MEIDQDDLQLELHAERFHIVDAGSANFLVRKIMEARKYAERVEVWAATEIRRGERQEAFFLGRWGLELEAFARRKIAQQFRGKSFSLPAGTIGFRIEPQRIDFQDEPRVMAWCRANLPSAIKRTETLLKSALSEHLKTSGEIPPGVEISGGNEKFFVR